MYFCCSSLRSPTLVTQCHGMLISLPPHLHWRSRMMELGRCLAIFNACWSQEESTGALCSGRKSYPGRWTRAVRSLFLRDQNTPEYHTRQQIKDWVSILTPRKSRERCHKTCCNQARCVVGRLTSGADCFYLLTLAYSGSVWESVV